MRELRIARPAGQDIENIFDYGAVRFGEAIALAYRDGLNAAFTRLLEQPLSGRARDKIRPGLPSRPYRSHVIFYVPTERDIRIIRVLHGKMYAVLWFTARAGR